MAGVAATWWVGKAYYDPAKIAVPVLLVIAAWDSDVPPAMARARSGAFPSSRCACLGEARPDVCSAH
jgi:hypothetical protein